MGTPPPLRLRDISLSTPWPNHLFQLICGSPPAEDQKIRIEELAACLCHVALIEIGFVPTFVDIEADKVSNMADLERIPQLSGVSIPSNQRNSVTGIYTISYKGIQVEISPTDTTDNSEQTDADPPMEDNQKQFKPLKFIYTKAVDIVMMFQNSAVSLYAVVKNETLVPATLNLQFNVQDYFTILPSQSVPSPRKIYCEERSGQEWLSLVKLRGSQLSDMIKSRFGLPLLNLVDGLAFETGLTDIPSEVLFKVCGYLDIRSIVHLTEVSWSFYGLTESNFFWLSRIDRDFPKYATEVRTLLASAAETPDANQPETPTAFSEYRRLYLLNRPQRPRRFMSYIDIPRRIRPINNRSLFMFHRYF